MRLFLKVKCLGIQLLIKSLLSFVQGCLRKNVKNAKNNSSLLNGIWTPVKQEMAGQDLPSIVFEKYKLTMTDSLYTYGSYDTDHGVTTYADGKMDIYGKGGVNAGKHFTAIYTYENLQLTICYNLKGDSYPEAFETTSKPMLFLSVFKNGLQK